METTVGTHSGPVRGWTWPATLPALAGGVGALTLLGWLGGSSALVRFGPVGFLVTSAAAALCMLVLAVAALLPRRPLVSAWLAGALAVGAGLVAVLTLVEWATGAIAVDPPGRMAPLAAVGILLLAAVLLGDGRARSAWAQVLLSAVLGLAIVGLVAAMFRALAPRRPEAAAMGVPGAVALSLLAVGLLRRAPDRGVIGLLRAPGPGGRLARWLLPATLVFPLALGGVLFRLSELGALNEEMAWALFVGAAVLLPAAAIGATAAVLEHTDHLRRAAQASTLATERARARAERSRADDLEHAQRQLAASEARARALIDHAPDAIVVLDVGTGAFVDANPEAERLFGMTREDLLAVGPAQVSPPLQPDGRPSAEAAAEYIGQALAGGFPVFEWLHRTGAGEPRLCEIRLLRLPGDRPLVRGSLLDIRERRRSELERARLAAAQVESERLAEAHSRAERLAEQRALLLRLNAELGRATDLAQVGQAIASTGAGAVGAEAARVWWRDESGGHTLLTGGPEAARLDDDPVAVEVLRRCAPVLPPAYPLGRPDGAEPAGPADPPVPVQAGLPLLVDRRMLGVLTFEWTSAAAFRRAEPDLLRAVAAQSAAALDRARLFDAERAARASSERAQQRLRLLAEGGALLAESTDEVRLVDRLAGYVAERAGSWAMTLEPDHEGRLRVTALRVSGQTANGGCRELVGTALPDLAGDDVRAVAWREGRPARTGDLGPATEVLAVDPPGLAERLADVRFGAALAVPLIARADIIGVLLLGRPAGGAEFTDDDATVMADLARRAGAKLDNLRLLAARTQVAARLQRALLPQRLPPVTGAEVAVRYLVGDQAAEVGGDFYDVFPLADNEYALVIGDVCGRGVDAAGLTGFARATLRAVADLPPAEALRRLNQLLLTRGDNESLVTAAYLRLRLDPDGGGELTTCLAGHPPPLLARSGAEPRPLGEAGLVLGVLENPAYTESLVELRPGDTLVLYTDGIIEAKGADGLFGADRLAELVGAAAGESAEEVVGRLEAALMAYRDRGNDDTALLVLRTLGSTETGERYLVDQHLAADLAAVRAARTAAADAVRDLVGDTLAHHVAVGVSELVTNAVRQMHRHPNITLRPDPVQLRVLRRAGVLRVEVHNPGPTFSPPEGGSEPMAESGRGLAVVRALFDRMGVDTASGNTCVWFELALHDSGAA